MKPAEFLVVLVMFCRLVPGLPVLYAASDWPRFLGPNGAATSTDATIPLSWNDTNHLAWKTDLPGPGNSSPIVWGDAVFVTCYTGYGLDRRAPGEPNNLTRHLLRLDARTGKIVWDRPEHATQPEDPYTGYITEHGYASNTPVTDGRRIFVNYGKSGVFAYDMDGRSLWQAGIGTESSSKRWGSAASPILYRNLVIVNAAEESHALVAFDQETGKTAWKSEAESLSLAYGTPRLVTLANGRTELLLYVPGEIWGLNPDSGNLHWYCESPFGGNISPSVVVGDGVVFGYGGFPKKGSLAIKYGGRGDVTGARLWTSDRTPYVSTPVYHEGLVYWVTRDGFAECQDARTGQPVYKERLHSRTAPPRFYASPVLVNGHIVMVSRNAGTFVYRAGSTFEPVGQNLLSDPSEFNATPALAGGRLFLRSHRSLYAIAR